MHALITEKKILDYQKNNLIRKRICVSQRAGPRLKVNQQWVVPFCHNDYLNITTHPDVKKSFAKAANKYGLGSGSSSLIAGFWKPHALLEDAFAKFLNRERALLFNSGYHANLGVITTFAHRNSAVFSDKLCHASLIDGIFLSHAKHYRYHNHDVTDADKKLRDFKKSHSLLITESIFSMEGNIIDIPALANVALKHNALFVVDDAHGFGILGKSGQGISEHFSLTEKDIPCLITPFGKALGSFGAIVSGSDTLIESLLQFARTYRYSTALPPALAVATLTALKILSKESWRREKLAYLSQLFNQEAIRRQLPLISHDLTPIKCIILKSNTLAMAIQNHLLKKGFLVASIRPPTVPLHTARLRISLNCNLSEFQVIQLLDEIALFLQKKSVV